MAKKKVNDTFTVKDFKMWLLGMTEFQEDGWTPNAKQWKTILDKVDMLDESVQYVQVESKNSNNPPVAQHYPPQQNQPVPPANNYGFNSFDISQTAGGTSPLDAQFPANGSGIIDANPGQSFI